VKLKPCPFCGSPAQIIKWCINEEAFKPFYLVDCPHCGIGTPKMISKAKAVRVWNRRK
jgi:Lar family restriction alleviation protein